MGDNTPDDKQHCVLPNPLIIILTMRSTRSLKESSVVDTRLLFPIR